MNMYDTLKASNCVIPIVKKLNSKIDLRQNQGNNVDLKIGQAEKAHCFTTYLSSTFTPNVKCLHPIIHFSETRSI